MATDILGISDRDKRIIALAGFYHANSLFETTKKNPPQARREELAIVAKLAAILRLADAMDRGYCQKLKTCTVSIKEQTMILNVQSKMDISLESWTFDRKSEFFEEVFGLEPVLEQVN